MSAGFALTTTVSGCGGTLPSTTPLSPPRADAMARVRPSSTRAVIDAEEHPPIQNEISAPDQDDDDDDSTATDTRLIE